MGPERGQPAPGSRIPGMPERSVFIVTSDSFEARHWLSWAGSAHRRRLTKRPSETAGPVQPSVIPSSSAVAPTSVGN
jgi:hypothetical protein